ncbi:NAD(P)/FAD-dependent oxidoreductase [Marivirga arenosa]|uniref:Ferredoxin--NADP reductase n=1 Tax=Marivirga arenosa TaxID=3059076 RepID=A0AA52F1A5_9BACT|nr:MULTISPECIES: NAD(P)/FAD-dependent oxidoreductase [unclassified Marivirga]WMN07206.1 NAD(P)/FAD-dependent oxidoreductase [Marivirga sp. ABR2-2]WNB18594.1 NAD(P)/FAD-dependent oxidoreductase [Marivirga sp. BKB1-2]
MVQTDICIIGAGPVGLFAVFEAGLLKLRCHLVDALPQVGGQLSEIYPQKPIYDIPGYPEVKAQELVDNLMDQIEPFNPTFTLGERLDQVEKTATGFYLKTSDGTEIDCKAVVIAGGLGCFEPRKPPLKEIADFEGKGVSYMVKDPEQFRDKNVILAGGGDSALDWTIELSKIAKKITLVHRNETFRGAPDSAEKVFELAKEGKINLLLKSNLASLSGNGHLESVKIKGADKSEMELEADYLVPLFGLSPKLGPIADWGLAIHKNQIEVNTEDYSTNVPGIYAIGDINTYKGKLKLILCGFHEAALMAQSAFKHIYPDKHLSFKYTTVNGIESF